MRHRGDQQRRDVCAGDEHVGDPAQPGRRPRRPAAGRAARRAGTGGGQRVQPGQRLQRRAGQGRRQRQQLGRHPDRRPARPRRPAPARTSSSDGGRALQHGAGVGAAQQRLGRRLRRVRRRPRSRSIASMPSRAAANADGTPSRASQASFSGGRGGRGHAAEAWHRQVASGVMSQDDPRLYARSFGAVADAYDRGRPSYPREAAAWLAAETPLTVLELGAGTGKLTEQLVALGHDVHATEPDAEMLARLQRAPAGRPDLAGRGRGDPGGRPLLRRRGRARRPSTGSTSTTRCPRSRGSSSPAAGCRWCGTSATSGSRGCAGSARSSAPRSSCESPPRPSRARRCSAWSRRPSSASVRTIDQHSIEDLVLSRSNIATLPPDDARSQARRGGRVLRRVRPRHGRHAAPLRRALLPHRCWTGRRRTPGPPRFEPGGDQRRADRTSDGSDADMLLIDFR